MDWNIKYDAVINFKSYERAHNNFYNLEIKKDKMKSKFSEPLSYIEYWLKILFKGNNDNLGLKIDYILSLYQKGLKGRQKWFFSKISISLICLG